MPTKSIPQKRKSIKLLHNGSFMLFLTLAALLTSCVSQRLPDGAYTPARAANNNTQPQASTHIPSNAPATTTAAQQLGIRSDRSDDIRLLTACASYLGTPYRYGGNDRTGIDCSGLTTNIYRDVYGITLHRRSIDQYEKDVPQRHTEKLRQGDLVFFTTNGQGTCSHVGIYLKDNAFIHASSTNGVVVNRLTDTYYAPRFLGGGRP